MQTIITRNAVILLFMNLILSQKLYSFVARNTLKWTNELAPPSRDTVVPSDFDDDILYMKRVDMRDLRFMYTRTNWVSGTYAVDDVVITTDFNIYQRTTAGSSTTKPTHVSGTASGWAFIRTVPTEEQTYFLTSTLIPLTIASEKLFFDNTKLKTIKVKVDIVGTEDDYLPLTFRYRVVGLWANPPFKELKIAAHSSETDPSSYGIPIAWNTLMAAPRVDEQTDVHTFDLTLPT